MRNALVALACAALVPWPAPAHADAITDWNTLSGDVVTAAGLGTPPANRLMAIAHTAAYEAAFEAAGRDPARNGPPLDATTAAKVDAAIAAAFRTALTRLLPAQRVAVDNTYSAALARITDANARTSGTVLGERVALDVITRRTTDGAATPESYRPHATPGQYVPTVIPAVQQWPQRAPWLMERASTFRPGPPPALASERWARDYNEIKALGGRASATRTAAQSEVARFWEATLPPIYHGVVRSVALQPGRDVLRNARLFAAVTQGIDDALIAVFDAKYHYHFWRPVTAIRNGDLDGNDATERDAAWLPFIDTPMHPEYPCAHCIQAGVVSAILRAEIGRKPVPLLATTSTSAGGARREWTSIDAFVQEVNDARVLDGVHFRTSTEVGADMGRRIGELAVRRFLGE